MASPLILAHRGDASRARENTLAAFEDALRAGADGIEFDVRAGPAGLLVHHDPTLRLRGRRRRLTALTPAQVPDWLPSLEAVVAWGRNKALLLDVEIKEPGTEPQILDQVRPVMQKCVFTSFHPDVVHGIRALAPDARVGWISKSSPEAIEAIATELRPPIVVLPARRCTQGMLDALRALGCKAWAWNVNAPQTAHRLASLGVEAFITDEPRRLISWRGARGPRGTGPRTGRREN